MLKCARICSGPDQKCEWRQTVEVQPHLRSSRGKLSPEKQLAPTGEWFTIQSNGSQIAAAERPTEDSASIVGVHYRRRDSDF